MKLTLTLDDQKWNWLLQKTQQDSDSAEQNVLDKVNEYLDACGRDVGANVDAEIAKKLALKTATEKQDILATL